MENTTTTAELSNTLKTVINTRDVEGNQLKITIKLGDDCKNGHQDFSITASAWEKGRPKTDNFFIYGGCCHDEIIKAHPELKIFTNLHLCDYSGVPMYAVENGFYHLKEGFNNTKPNSPEFKAEFCEYYRVTPEQFDQLEKAENKLRYAIMLEKLGVLTQWKAEADKAIEILETMTDKKFLNNSTKQQYTPVKKEEKQTEEEKEKAGYYTPEKIAQREEQKKADNLQKIKDDLLEHLNKEIKKETDEYNVKLAVLDAGQSIDNFIYYNHTNTGAFNWRDSSRNKITEQEFNDFLSRVNTDKLPEGIKFTCK